MTHRRKLTLLLRMLLQRRHRGLQQHVCLPVANSICRHHSHMARRSQELHVRKARPSQLKSSFSHVWPSGQPRSTARIAM